MDTTNDADHASLTETVHDAKTYRRTFLVMCLAFGLNHAAVTTPVGYATALLGGQLGSLSLAVLYGVCLISALFLGPLFTSSLGPRNALVLGMGCYVVYVLCFAIATHCTNGAEAGVDITVNTVGKILAIGGSVIGGVGAGSLWTAQGAFFGAICESLAAATGQPLQGLTAQLSSQFAIFYLGQECLWKVFFTVMTKYMGVSNTLAFVIYGVLALLATVGMAMGQDARPKGGVTSGPLCAKAAAAFSLWPDPNLWLLSGLNITFGFSAAYLSGYINAHWQAKALNSTDFIGFLGAIIALVATLSSWLYGWVSTVMGTKMPVVAFGSVCFFLIAILSFVTAPGGQGPGGWGWGIIVFYFLQGMGRGVYESTNKGLFADAFQGAKSTGAFANCMMQSTGASTIGFIMGAVNVDKYESWPLIVFSLITVPMLLVSLKMRQQSVKMDVQG